MRIIVSESTYKKHVLLESINLSSFEMRDTLSPDIFDENEMMLPEVREKLLKIGKDFFEYLGTPWVDLQDIILTGSLANYNWSKFSDVDLHVVIPYNQVSKNPDLVDEFAWTKKELWNEEHNIMIKEYEVELYAQDSEDDLVAGGIYSVLNDKWIKKPVKKKVKLDTDKISKIVDFFEDKIGELFRKYLSGNRFGLIDDVDNLKDAIRSLRKKGLSTGGEFSPQNIAFKALRRMDLLDKLSKIKDDLYDSELSIEDPLEKQKKVDPEVKKSEPDKQDKDDDDDREDVSKGVPQWEINGKQFVSVRDAAKATGVPKSTVAYRANSENFPSWKNLTNK